MAATNLAVAYLNAQRPAEAVDACYRALSVQQEQDGSLNEEAFANLNIALRICNQRQRAIEETWIKIASLSTNPTAFCRPRTFCPGRDKTLSKSQQHVSVVCVKWGQKYGADYVNRLMRAVSSIGLQNVEHSFVCFTDDAHGLDPRIQVVPLEDKGPNFQGWWYKASLFRGNCAELNNSRVRGKYSHDDKNGDAQSANKDKHAKALKKRNLVLYLDLDTVIVGSLCPLLDYSGGFATLGGGDFSAEESIVGGYNSSVMLWDTTAQDNGSGKLSTLHDALTPNVLKCLMRWDHWVEMIIPEAHIIQDIFPGVVVDYRKHCTSAGPPPTAAIVCFPRFPKPHQVEDAWVVKNWRTSS